MNQQETRQLLKTRAALTSQPYGDDAIDAWHDALEGRTYTECRRALLEASREHSRISVAQVVQHLPPRAPMPANPLDTCELCDNTGWVNDDRYHSTRCPRTGNCHCHGVKPCRCTPIDIPLQTRRH